MTNELLTSDFADSQIVKAHDYFREKTEYYMDQWGQDGQQDSLANALEQAVSHYLEIVVIDLGDSDDSHVIFETLNARGTPLLQSDMIKNMVFHDAGLSIGPNLNPNGGMRK